ncbi:MAG: ligase-associated DNA damage response exonuclease [Bacteroidota bacterium]
MLQFKSKGIYCPQADVYIDPWKPVKRALITHGHADHSKWGHQHYLCTHSAKPVIQYRLGNINIESVAYGETVTINGVKFSFHPAGHIIGSAQIRAEYKGEVWVVSGDYKVQNDGISEAFESVKCHAFITESTFGLPIYKWKPQAEVMQEINAWWQRNKALGKVSIIGSYALGKAQRLIQNLDASIGEIYTHGAIENTNQVIRKQGIKLQATTKISAAVNKKEYIGSMVIATPSAMQSNWMRRFSPVSTALASGWMTLRGARRRRSADRGFVLSDHADWDGLNSAIKASGAERIFVTHGYTEVFSKWLNEQGYQAAIVKTEYSGELADLEENGEEEKAEE